MKKLKVMTVVGTRPEIIKLAEVMRELDHHTEHVIVHTGQNYDYELNEVFFKDLDLRKPDHFLEAAGDTPSKTVAKVIEKMDDLLASEKPDALLILGDTNSCISAYPAKRRKIPIFHMEAGNRCFDMRVPEEVNRRVVDHLSDINMPFSEAARYNLLREGLPADRVIKTGSPMREIYDKYRAKIAESKILEELSLTSGEYFLLSLHREENVDNPEHFESLMTILREVVKEYKKPIIFGAHPRTKKRLEAANAELPPEVRIVKPFGLFDYAHLEMNALCVMSDSGTIQEDSAILNFPAIQLRETHERLEATEEGTVIMAGLNPERVLQALAVAIEQKRGDERELRIPADYDVPNVSKKIVRTIIGYVDYVKRVVWSESA